MKPINQVVVRLELQSRRLDVGELVQQKEKIYFKFYLEFIKLGLSISPFKLELDRQIQSSDVIFFDGLYGVFYDSLPDGWGKLLMDRYFLSKGYALHNISPLQRLTYVNTNSPGALRYSPSLYKEDYKLSEIDLSLFANKIQDFQKAESSTASHELLALGGSSGGARPKINVFYNPQTDSLLPSGRNMPSGYEPWLIKFPASSDDPEIGKIEFAYHLMALEAGIEMQECRLFQDSLGRKYFGTKRFDRLNGQNLHVISAAGLMHDNYRMSNMDYGHLMDAAFRLERNHKAYEKILRLAAFNVLSHNRDDHSKNFSFLMDEEGNWKFAPAYDLTFSHSGFGYHSTTVAGESKSPGQTHLMQLAKEFDIDNAVKIIDEVKSAIGSWRKYANEVGLSKSTTDAIQNVIV